MDKRYKVILSNKNIYKEIELAPDVSQIKVGFGLDADIRLLKEYFFENVELLFINDGNDWSVICSDNLYLFVGDVRKLFTKKLVHGDNIEVRYHESDGKVFAFEYLIDFNDGKKKYERSIDVSEVSTVKIGNCASCDIFINSAFLQNELLVLKKNGSGFEIDIKQTTYGVYINGYQAENNDMLNEGDFLSISDVFFYYQGNSLMTQISQQIMINSLKYVDNPLRENYPKFSRNTRVKTIINNESIEVLDPPAKPQKPKNNLVIRLLPSFSMLIVAAIMAFLGGAMVVMSLISGGMAILTTIMTFRENQQEYKKNSVDRINKYNAYIVGKRYEIEKFRAREKKMLEDIYISQEIEKERLYRFSSSLFDRTKGDEDFLCIKLGNGLVEAQRKIIYKKQERLEIEDELQLLPEQIGKEYKFINDAPVICDLKIMNAMGIIGDENYCFSMMKNIVMDIIVRQYFSDVRLAFVAEEKHADKILWLRMLPHVYDEETGIRMIVTSNDSKNIIFEYLYKELTVREQEKKYNHHLILFFYDEFGFKNHPISRFVEKAEKIGVTFIFFGEKKADIPLGCDYIVSSNGDKGLLVPTRDKRGTVEFSYPVLSDEEAQKMVDLLAPVFSEEISLEGSLTKNISLFEMLDILSVTDLNLENRWKKSQVYKSMAAPLGVSKRGIVYLDLHDKAHGPHGLVAGTTGSGKSEILQTYILSIATLFHPYEVAFVIIDFKGGGMVNQFKDLPHLLGAITNIDGKEIERSLRSIKAELQKRQRLFAEAEVNHIDKYIRKYKAGEVEVPLPHLVLIVDEFAELKAEQPEFMKELISAARIGRSLGVHLILATQKPSGQVNEQIWSNSRFKLCLKVQSQEDSNEVLKSPLAAEIKEPGRAYLQVGNNEVFELFQSAYSGATEKMDDIAAREFSIYSLSTCGKKTPIYIQKKQQSGTGSATQLEAVIRYVDRYCKNKNIQPLNSICLPALKDYLVVPGELPEYSLASIPLGIYDDPDSQYQGYARFNFSEENIFIVGSSQTGKTNLLQSIIRMVAVKCSPKEAVFYIADFGAMYLKNFEALHHVGGVVTLAENEKFKNLFKLLMEEIQYRKSKFLNVGLSSYSAYLEAGNKDLPHIFFFIDNFSAFKEVYAEAYEDQFMYLTREGISCGISVVVTNGSTNGFGYRYMSNFGCRFAFKCNDASEYMNVFDRCRITPKDVTGRMLCRLDKELYEMQSFIAFEGEKEFERSAKVKQFVECTNKKYSQNVAKKIPSIPEVLTLDYISQNYTSEQQANKYPFALEYANVDVVSLDFKEMNEFCIVGKDERKRLTVTNCILSAIHYNAISKPVALYIIDGVERRLKAKGELSYVERYTIDYSEIGNIFDSLMPELGRRYQLLMDGDFEQLAKCEQILFLINNRDAVEYISTTKEVLEVYNRIIKQFKSLGVAFIFSDVEDVAVNYNSPDLLKRFKEARKGIIASNLQEVKFCEIPSNVVRGNKTVNVGDVFLMNGSEFARIKLAEEVCR